MKIKPLWMILCLCMLVTLLPLPAQANQALRADGCQCTDFVYNHRPDIPLGMGHAKQWVNSARQARIPYDQVPQVGDVAVILAGEFGFSEMYGHVAMVVAVNHERTRFSIAGWDGLKDDCQLEMYVDLPVTANTIFIHQRLPLSNPCAIEEIEKDLDQALQ